MQLYAACTDFSSQQHLTSGLRAGIALPHLAAGSGGMVFGGDRGGERKGGGGGGEIGSGAIPIVENEDMQAVAETSTQRTSATCL